MPLLDVDASGLTTSGAVLGFAPASGVPVLVDSALGRVTLYFRDDAGQFLLAYFDTLTGRAMLHVPADAGEVTFVARSAAAEMDEVSVTVSAGADDATCTLVVTLPGDAGVTETWTDLPRDTTSLGVILNGTAQPTFLATVKAASGKADTLTLNSPLQVPVPAGALVTLGSTVLTTTASAARGAMSLPVQPKEISVADGAALNRIAYDYASATSTRAGTDLSGGSALVGVDVRGATGAMQLGTAELLGSTSSCQWFAAPPGTTIDFNGKTTRAGVLANTAIRLDGKSGVTLAAHGELDITGAVTLEAWVRPRSTKDYGNIVVRGFTMQPNGEVYLRISNGQYQIGSWDGTDHFATSAVPAGDIGTWVHLAGVYDGTAWHLYRNGLLLASSVDAVGAVEVAGRLGHWHDVRRRRPLLHRRHRRRADLEPAARRAGDHRRDEQAAHRRRGGPRGLPLHGRRRARRSRRERGGHPGSGHSGAGAVAAARSAGWADSTSPATCRWRRGSTRPASGDSRLLLHRSSASSYGLALRQQRTARHFDGVAGHLVVLPDVPALGITGEITIEAWVRPSATDGLRDIVARGPSTPAAEVYLRLSGGAYQIGRWSGVGSEATASLPDPVG